MNELSLHTCNPVKASERLTCGWACIATIAKARPNYILNPDRVLSDEKQRGLTTQDKQILLARLQYQVTEVPKTFNPVNIPGMYILDGYIRSYCYRDESDNLQYRPDEGHSVLVYIAKQDMNVYFMDPRTGTWLLTAPEDFVVTTALFVEDALLAKLSFEDQA